MSPAQFALAVGADQRWIRNARRTLRRRRCTSQQEARWLGLVHELHLSPGLALHDAARVADQVSAAPTSHGCIQIDGVTCLGVSLVVDLERVHALHALRLARAMHLLVRDHRGRPATSYRRIVADLARCSRRTCDPIRLALSAKRPAAERLAALGSMSELLVGLATAGVRFIAHGDTAGALLGTLRQPSAVDVLHDASDSASSAALARVLATWNARPRGIAGRDWVIDVALIRALPTLVLDTDLGPLNLWTRCHVIGDYAQARERTVDGGASGLPFAVLGLEALAAVERANGRATDHELLYELRQLVVELERAARLERYRRSISSSSRSIFA